MTSDILTIKGRDEAGYGICIDSAESWIVALNNAGPDSDRGKVTFLGAHPNTDETFVLIKGRACLVTSPHEEPENLKFISMEQGVCYNVHRNTWHTVLMTQGAKVVICENRSVTSDRHDLSDEARKRLEYEAGEILNSGL